MTGQDALGCRGKICLLIATTGAISLELMQRLGHKGTILVNDCHYRRLERANINLGERSQVAFLNNHQKMLKIYN